MKYIINLLILTLVFLSCRKFDWDNPNDTITAAKEPASLKDGLVAYYPFNGNANDESGNGNHCLQNQLISTSDRKNKINSAFRFSETSFARALFNIESSPISFLNYSVSIWVKPILSINNRIILQYKEGDFNSPNNNLDIFYSHSSCQGQSIGLGQYPFSFQCSSTSNLDKWTNIVVVYRNSRKIMDLYIGGVFSTTTIMSNAVPGSGIMSIGNNSSNAFSFNGDIDDIRIYNRALTQEEITYLANN